MAYKLGNTPDMTAEHNKASWHRVEKKLLEQGVVEFDQLVEWAEGHKHDAGAKGFINYCISHDWIIKA